MIFIVNESVSMDSKEFELICDHLQKLKNLVTECVVITADTNIQETFKIKNIKNDLKNSKIRFHGNYRSNIIDAFKSAEKLRPNLIIFYSDVEVSEFPTKPKKSKVIWLATKNSYLEDVPYGTLIKVK
jgi:hypothetical protein